MRSVPSILVALFASTSTTLADPPAPVRVELNVLDNLQDRCRVTFVVENRQPVTVDSLKLDLAVFNPEGAVRHRLIAELGPVRAAKTVVKAFAIDGACDSVGAILVNDVSACAPAAAEACLDALALSSRVRGVRLYK